MNKSILKAHKLFRARQWDEAKKIYQAEQDKTSNTNKQNEIRKWVSLCELKAAKADYGTQTASKASTSTVLPAYEDILDADIQKPRSARIRYSEELLTPGNTLNTKSIISHFLQSPYQTLLAYAALVALRSDINTNIIKEKAKLNHAAGKLTYGLVLNAFISHHGHCLLRDSLETNLNINATSVISLSYFYANPLDTLGLTGRNLENYLRKACRTCEKYIFPLDLLRTSADTNETISRSALPHEHSVHAASIFLNEAQYIQKCYFNHYSLVDSWTFVEGACIGYPPDRVSNNGLSTDHSWLKLVLSPDPDNKVRYIEHGWTKSNGESAKSELRNDYLAALSNGFLAVIDIDEFYSETSFKSAIGKLKEGYSGVVVPQLHFWKHSQQFIIGGYYDVSHMRFFRVQPGIRYVANHNFPELPCGTRLDTINNFKFSRTITNNAQECSFHEPFCFHLGFAKEESNMKDKTLYYLNRGEAQTRPDTTKSRAAWFDNSVPDNCKVLKFSQPLLEILKK